MRQPTPLDSQNSKIAFPIDFGRYRLEKVLGYGAMGIVYLAHDKELGRPIALKVPKFPDEPSPQLLERFRREARSAAVLNHPNICPVYDVGQFEGQNFICMGYVEGRSLADLIAAGTQWTEHQAALAIRKLALALREAHQRGIVHRDLKPGNIMINHRGDPVIMDFGLSRRSDDGPSRLTEDGTVVGTPAYMAPEQLRDHPDLGPSIDIYSLGVVLYEMLTGKTPFSGSAISVISQVLHSEPVPIEQLRQDISLPMVAICRRAMQKNPQDRFATMDEFATALNLILKAESSLNIPEMSTAAIQLAARQGEQDTYTNPAMVDTIAARRLSPTSAPPSKPGTTRLKKIVLGLLGCGLVVFAIVAIPRFRPGGPPPPPDSPPPANNRNENGRVALPPAFRPPDDVPPHEQFASLDHNQDGFVDRGELVLHAIHRADTNDDERLTREEYLSALRHQGPRLFAPPEHEPPFHHPGKKRPPKGK